MVTLTQLLTLIFGSGILSTKIAVNGSKPTCRPNATVNLTGEEPDCSGSVHKSGYIFPPEAIWTENNTDLFGCICYFQHCLPLCCPVGLALGAGDRCLSDKYTSGILNWKERPKESYAFFDGYCMSKKNTSIAKHFVALESGQLMLMSNGAIVELGEYCLVRLPNSRQWFALVCTANSSYNKATLPIPLAITSLNVSMLFALATFIVYSLIPELKNLQGSILRSYLASYIVCIIFITVVLVSGVSRFERLYLTIIVNAAHYFGIACLMWLNVMSLDIWRKFRKVPFSPDVSINNRRKLTFICYSVYAWGGSAVPPIISHVYSRFISKGSRQTWLWWYLMFWPLAVIPFCNMCLFAATTLKIRRLRKETSNQPDDVNQRHEENNQWFTLRVKLFLIMGGPLIFWAIAFYWGNSLFFDFVCILEALQGISIFYIFIWKDGVKRLLRQRFQGMLLRVLVYFSHRRTPAIGI